MTAAFKEYTGKSLNKSKKPSVRRKLELAKERVAKHREREKTKQKERGRSIEWEQKRNLQQRKNPCRCPEN